MALKAQQVQRLRNAVENSLTESDLSHNWLVPLLGFADHSGKLELNWEKKNQKGRKDLSIRFNNREVCVVELKKPDITVSAKRGPYTRTAI